MSDAFVAPSIEAKLKLDKAVLLYTGGGHAYASVHDVDDNGRIQPGRSLEGSAIAPIMETLSAKRRYVGYLPATVLYAEHDCMVWWVPPSTRHVWFACGSENAGANAAPATTRKEEKSGAQLLGKRSGATPHPGLVFAVSQGRWYVRALRGADRPEPGTELCVAPYFNVWDSSEICTGNVRLPDRCDASTLGKFEDSFFRSRFTHPNVPQLTSHPRGAYVLWDELLLNHYASFPVRYLRPTKQTLDRWVKDITKGKK